MASSSSNELGEVLLNRKIITNEQLRLIRDHQKRKPRPTHRIILELDLASEQDTLGCLAEIHGIPFRDLRGFSIPAEALSAVPLKILFHYRFVPIAVSEGSLTVACGDLPSDLEVANLRLLLKREIHFTLTTPSQIESTLHSEFGLGAETVQKLRESKGDLLSDQERVFDLSNTEGSEDVEATISDLVDQILREALRLRSTDIHFEPYADSIKLRYRIDGILQGIPIPAELKPLYSAIVSRLKVMAELDISERRFPQDGRISMKTDGDAYDLRVSVIPTKYGEALCLRILGRQSLFLGLGQLGMLPDQERSFSQMIALPQGLVLLSGPTGSGKTTTLYAALMQANDHQRKIITIEDPVEYRIEGIAQMQTHEAIGLSFSRGLRAILRHDPDLVLVGEIRDRETAEIAVRASQTGHLVFTTLHANDSLAAIPRLIDMGVEAGILASSLHCSIAQRLARKTCKHCQKPDHDVSQSLLEEMATALDLSVDALLPMRGLGCVKCQQTGVRGRLALYEFAFVSEAISDVISKCGSSIRLRKMASDLGWRSLRQVAFRRVEDASISLRELERITWRHDFSEFEK